MYMLSIFLFCLSVFVVTNNGLPFNTLSSFALKNSTGFIDVGGRLKREASTTCCGIDMDSDDAEDDHDEECAKKVLGDDMDEEELEMKQLYCLMECDYAEILNDDGGINEKSYFEMLEGDEMGENAIDTSKKAFKKCVEIAKMHKDKVMKRYKDLKCNPMLMDFITCISVEVLEKCSVEKKKEDHSTCEEVINVLKETYTE